MTDAPLPLRAFLLHVTHNDPKWAETKETEEPFDPAVAREVIDAMAEAGLNLLVLDIEDGVRYPSHPELAKHYSRDIGVLAEIASHAAKREIELVPKLNFSRSEINRHDHWTRRPGAPWYEDFDTPEYWRKAFACVDDILGLVPKVRFFHVGMDEDHERSYLQYTEAITTLRDGLKERGLRTLIWNDSAINYPTGFIHRDKSRFAEPRLPKDVIHVVWNYRCVPVTDLERIRQAGFDVWGAPGGTPELVTGMRDALADCGGSGILLTRWIPCIPANRETLVELVRGCGPLCSWSDGPCPAEGGTS